MCLHLVPIPCVTAILLASVVVEAFRRGVFLQSSFYMVVCMEQDKGHVNYVSSEFKVRILTKPSLVGHFTTYRTGTTCWPKMLDVRTFLCVRGVPEEAISLIEEHKVNEN